MEKAANRKKVFDTLQEALKADKARSNVLRISELGLVQMTRKRTRESLGQLLLESCPHCDGLGRQRSVETLASDALRQLERVARDTPGDGGLALGVHRDVAAFLATDGAGWLDALVARLGRAVRVVEHADGARDVVRVEPA
jgi:ribonuclease G